MKARFDDLLRSKIPKPDAVAEASAKSNNSSRAVFLSVGRDTPAVVNIAAIISPMACYWAFSKICRNIPRRRYDT
jgi:hypothetical protein